MINAFTGDIILMIWKVECFSREVTPHIELCLCIDKVLTKLNLHLTILSSDKHKHQLVTFILFVLKYLLMRCLIVQYSLDMSGPVYFARLLLYRGGVSSWEIPQHRTQSSLMSLRVSFTSLFVITKWCGHFSNINHTQSRVFRLQATLKSILCLSLLVTIVDLKILKFLALIILIFNRVMILSVM